tara:strand:- start:2033 stop:2629 length:597 start_codon:yes stop_codon:yes gene_type:complete
MDILGVNGGGNSMNFLSFKTNSQDWWINNESVVDFNYMQIDTDTIQSGWGIYTPQSGYDHVWDEKLGVRSPQPAAIGDVTWKRAFSVWLFLDGWDEPVIWQRHSFGERESFNKILPLFWNSLASADKGTLPTIKYTGSKKVSVGAGFSSEIEFDFVDFKPRKAEFILPEWVSDDAPSAVVEMQAEENRKPITTDDIPF